MWAALARAFMPWPSAMAPMPASWPQAMCRIITWHLRVGEAKARQKRPQRTALLAQAGITTAPLTSIDWIDAALCALAAHRVASGAACLAFGEPDNGLIVVPERPGATGETGLDRPNLSV